MARTELNPQYLSITSPPPPPISQILTLSLPRAITFALGNTPSETTNPLPDLGPITSKLTQLTPSPGAAEALKLLNDKGNGKQVKVLVITNGSKSTTETYLSQAGLSKYVEEVKSCDEVGVGKPLDAVYASANELCAKSEESDLGNGKGKGERWFVAAHMWDLAAALKAG